MFEAKRMNGEEEICQECNKRPGKYINNGKLLCVVCEHAAIHKEFFKEDPKKIYKPEEE